MEVHLSEEDFLKLQNDKVKDYNSNRVKNKNIEVRVEARVESLESKMIDVNSEIKMMNRTMQDIADTLREIKDDQKKIQTFEIQKALLERDMLDQKKLIELLFKKADEANKSLNEMKETNAGNNIKINNNERVFWLIVTAGIGAIGWFNKQ